VRAEVLICVTIGVEDRDRLARPGIAVGARDHRIVDIVSEQTEPVVKAPVVKQASLTIQELLDASDHLLVKHFPLPSRPSIQVRSNRSPLSAPPTAYRTGDDCFR